MLTDDQLTKHINAKVNHGGYVEALWNNLILDGWFTIDELKEIIRIYEENRPPV